MWVSTMFWHKGRVRFSCSLIQRKKGWWHFSMYIWKIGSDEELKNRFVLMWILKSTVWNHLTPLLPLGCTVDPEHAASSIYTRDQKHRSGFESCLYCLLAMWLWARFLTSMSLPFLIGKVEGGNDAQHSIVVKMKWNDLSEVLSTTHGM